MNAKPVTVMYRNDRTLPVQYAQLTREERFGRIDPVRYDRMAE